MGSCRYSSRSCIPIACATSEPPLLATQLDNWIVKALKNERKRRGSLEKEADSAKAAEKQGRWASLVMANLYRIDDSTEKIVVEDWDDGGKPIELTFNLELGTPREQADDMFKKVKKGKRSSAVVANLLEQSYERELQLEQWREDLAGIGDGDEDFNRVSLLREEIFKRGKKLKFKLDSVPSVEGGSVATKSNKEKGSPQEAALFPSQTKGWTGRQFTSPDGTPILVGRNRRENEYLSLSLARDPDVWMHVRGSPGAHVVLQISRVKGKPKPSDECLQMAADLAAFYSEMRDENKVPVSVANPRYIKKPNGAPLGTVRIDREGSTIIAQPAKSSFIPYEIKERRERDLKNGKASKWTD